MSKNILRYGVGGVVGMILTLVASSVFGSPGREVRTFTNVETASNDVVEQEVTIEYISKKLENISELATAEMVYNNLYTVSEGKIPFITKKGFSMVYTATVKAGIDASLIDIDITEDEVKVIIPESQIQYIHVEPDSIQFYDEKKALFNWNEKEDVTAAISTAEKDAEEKADTDGLKKRANEEAKYIVKGILERSVGDKELVVVRANEL